MAMQNLISADLSDEGRTVVAKDLDEVAKVLSFGVRMTGAEVHAVVKAGKELAPFLDKVMALVTKHPEIVPKVFPIDEFKRDYKLYKDIEPIARQIDELAESVHKTMMAASSDSLVAGLELYRAAKQNAAHIPGLDALVADMALYFARPRRSAKTSKSGADRA